MSPTQPPQHAVSRTPCRRIISQTIDGRLENHLERESHRPETRPQIPCTTHLDDDEIVVVVAPCGNGESHAVAIYNSSAGTGMPV